MAISNGATILKADLDGMTTPALALMATDTQQLPAGGTYTFALPGITAALSSGNPDRCRATFTAPQDLLIELVEIAVGGMSGGSVTTATLTCPGVLDALPLSLSLTAGTGRGLSLTFSNTTSDVSTAARVIPKGATVEIAVTTTNVATPCMCVIYVEHRAFFSRS